MPKSIEHYQQETGRARRDGLAAECLLFYSAADVMRWESLVERSAAEGGTSEAAVTAARDLLDHMRRFCVTATCRHQQLSEYFGQAYPRQACGACDVCLEEVEGLADATITTQKVLSCVARGGQRFGVEHIVDVLLGANTERVRRWGHKRLSTYGLLEGLGRPELTNVLYQLLDQGLLARTPGDRPVLQLADASWEVLRGTRSVRLLEPRTRAGRGGSGAGFGATPTEMGKVRDAYSALYRRGNTLDEMRTVLEESIATTGTLAATGNAGKITAWTSRMANDVYNMMAAAGMAGDFTAVDRKGQEYSLDTAQGREKLASQYRGVITKFLPPEFVKTAQQADKWASLVTELMYLEARSAEAGAKQFSDKDIEAMAQIVGANLNDPQALSDVILSSYNRAASDLEYSLLRYPPQVRDLIVSPEAQAELATQKAEVLGRWEGYFLADFSINQAQFGARIICFGRGQFGAQLLEGQIIARGTQTVDLDGQRLGLRVRDEVGLRFEDLDAPSFERHPDGEPGFFRARYGPRPSRPGRR